MPAALTSTTRHLTFAAEDGGFGGYHDLYAGGSTVSRLGSEFGATVVAHGFPGLLIFDRRVAGVVHHRDAARVRRDDFDHFNLQVLRAGRMAAGSPGDDRALCPGDVAVFDTSRPQRTVIERADYVTLSLPRDAVEAALPHARSLHGAVLPRGAAGLLGDFLLSLMRHAAALGPEVAARSAGTVADLLAGAAGDAGAGRGERLADDALASHRARGEAHIEANLSDPTLDVERIAAALGLSRSVLYRAFAPAGGVARRLTARRLARLRAALRRPGEHRSVADLAFSLGFASESHYSRAFRAAYGATPGQFRAEARGLRSAQGNAAPADRLSDWCAALR